MNDFRALNGKPRATVIESFTGAVTVIGPGMEKSGHETVKAAVESVEERGWVVGTGHYHGPSIRVSGEARG